ncbi:MAG: hypothetical protein RLZZ608_623, partial [Actinomycetota bacterium]
VRSLAVHPGGEFFVAGTGEYDGGYYFEGELLVHDFATGRTRSLFTHSRMVEEVSWKDEEHLTVEFAPVTDWEIDDWNRLEFSTAMVHRSELLSLDERTIDIDALNIVQRARHRPANPSVRGSDCLTADELAVIEDTHRHVWALAAYHAGVIAGREGLIDFWDSESEDQPRWRIPVEGTCTQLFMRSNELVATVWDPPVSRHDERTTSILTIDAASGEIVSMERNSCGLVLIRAENGDLLIRPTSHKDAGLPATVRSTGAVDRHVDVSGYDLFNHYFDIRRSPHFLTLVGDVELPSRNKYVARVTQSEGGWAIERLFPLDWTGSRQVFGGPGVWVTDELGAAIIHAGAIHDVSGLLPGNARVVRRRYPDGEAVWQVEFDNQVVAVDEADSVTIAVTNLGEAVGIDSRSGIVLWSRTVTNSEGHSVVPLSLLLSSSTSGWIGTLDGRVFAFTVGGA